MSSRALLFHSLLVLGLPSVQAVEVSAKPGNFTQCKFANTSSAGEASLTLEPQTVEDHEKWKPHFGVVLLDPDGNLMYKISVATAKDPIQFLNAQQMFNFSTNVKEPLHAMNIFESFNPPSDGKFKFNLWWDDSGLVRLTLNGLDTGRIAFSRSHQNWGLFVSGMKIKAEGDGIDFSDCEQ